jgi:hypothetical protein
MDITAPGQINRAASWSFIKSPGVTRTVIALVRFSFTALILRVLAFIFQDNY